MKQIVIIIVGFLVLFGISALLDVPFIQRFFVRQILVYILLAVGIYLIFRILKWVSEET